MLCGCFVGLDEQTGWSQVQHCLSAYQMLLFAACLFAHHWISVKYECFDQRIVLQMLAWNWCVGSLVCNVFAWLVGDEYFHDMLKIKLIHAMNDFDKSGWRACSQVSMISYWIFDWHAAHLYLLLVFRFLLRLLRFSKCFDPRETCVYCLQRVSSVTHRDNPPVTLF